MVFHGIPWNKGKPWPKEIKKKISESLKGRPKPWNSHHLSEATKKKLSELRKDKPAPWNSYPRSKEYRRKLSEAAKGHIPWNKGRTRTKHGN